MTDQPRRLSPFAWLMIGAATVVALLPWWRNHHYLRDLYDYGIVLAANGHLDRGELPYVNFTTPIQAGFLGMNWLIERAGGGTYAALTWGGAGLIVASSLLLTLMLARRWPWWAAVAVGSSVTIAGASQHTILWHNSLGVFCLALVTWSAACAPVLRRAAWPWHVLAATGLFLGGINKLNFQLVAVVVALAWAVRAGVERKADRGRAAVTGLAIVLVGAVLPVAAELVWTGASLPRWFHNVVQLAVGSRTAILRQILSPDFLLRPIHDYYGPQPLPQAGLVGAVLTLAALAGCWPAASGKNPVRRDRLLVAVAVLAAGAASAALLATNFEIASLGLGAWLVLVGSVWLGFAPGGRRAVFVGGLILPALVIGAASWWSAWRGQRSQFGYSSAPRREYLPAEGAGPAFARLAGLRLPPDIMSSLEPLEQALPDADGHRPVFYGLGTEWIDRYLPGVPQPGMPLWIHWGTTYSPADIARLANKLVYDDQYKIVLTTIARDEWPEPVRKALNQYYFHDLIGQTIRRWTRRDRDTVDLSDSIEAVSRLGGNVDGRFLRFDRQPLGVWRAPDGRLLLSTTHHTGQALLSAPTYRLQGNAVVNRLPGTGTGPLVADFKLTVHGAIPEDSRWSARVELPAGRQSVSVPFQADGEGKRLLLWVTQPPEQAEGMLAGYRDLEITHAVESDDAPQLRDDLPAGAEADPALAGSLFGSIAWRPQHLVVRGGGRASAPGLALPAGGELWLHTAGMTGEIRGQISTPAAGRPPVVRVLWYKGGRLQIMQQGAVPADRPFDFHVWTAEPGGWIGITVDRGEGVSPALIRVTGSTLGP